MKNLDILLLFDYYGDYLNDKQRELFDYYYNDDLSLTEIREPNSSFYCLKVSCISAKSRKNLKNLRRTQPIIMKNYRNCLIILMNFRWE